MKNYTAPEIEFAEFTVEDVITTSINPGAPVVEINTPNGTVNVNGLGEQDFSIFDVR